jgi:hypothetical protein
VPRVQEAGQRAACHAKLLARQATPFIADGGEAPDEEEGEEHNLEEGGARGVGFKGFKSTSWRSAAPGGWGLRAVGFQEPMREGGGARGPCT